MVGFESPPGRQAQVDFGDFRLPWAKRYALMVVLGNSRLLWVRFFPRKNTAALYEGLGAAFRFFGGVPQELLRLRLPLQGQAEPSSSGRLALPRIPVERRPLTTYARVTGGAR